MSFSGLIRIVVISMYLFPGSAKIFNEDRCMGSVYIRLRKGELNMKQINQFMFPLGSFFFFRYLLSAKSCL